MPMIDLTKGELEEISFWAHHEAEGVRDKEVSKMTIESVDRYIWMLKLCEGIQKKIEAALNECEGEKDGESFSHTEDFS